MLEKMLNDYYAKFGENYPLLITDCRSDEEIIADIEKCLRAGKRAKAPTLKDGMVY